MFHEFRIPTLRISSFGAGASSRIGLNFVCVWSLNLAPGFYSLPQSFLNEHPYLGGIVIIRTIIWLRKSTKIWILRTSKQEASGQPIKFTVKMSAKYSRGPWSTEIWFTAWFQATFKLTCWFIFPLTFVMVWVMQKSQTDFNVCICCSAMTFTKVKQNMTWTCSGAS